MVAHVGEHHVNVVAPAARGGAARRERHGRERQNDEGPRKRGPSATAVHQASYFSSTVAPASWSSF
jgi:hypothetical protein